LPFSNKNTSRRRRIIFRSIHLGLTYFAINEELGIQKEKPLPIEDYEVWKSLLYPLAANDEIMKKAIIEEGKSLSWITEKINSRRQSQLIS
tara:strand:- start:476 stop:748 length:273 start_codon:yes stop_codon:yes gene_type:complete